MSSYDKAHQVREQEGTQIQSKEMSDIQKQCWSYVTEWVKEDCEKEDRQFIEKVNQITQSEN
jgi:uncharacterized membrane-anchored protein YjiN (DUF445 family)